MAGGGVDLTVEQVKLQEIGKACKEHGDGKRVKRELSKELREVIAPAVVEIKSGLMAVGHAGGPTVGEPLRATVAKGIKSQARFSGQATGVRVSAKRTPNLRGFNNAAKALNTKKGWRHRVMGDADQWVDQFGNPGYFDDPIQERKDDYTRAVVKVMADTAKEIAKEGA